MPGASISELTQEAVSRQQEKVKEYMNKHKFLK